MSDNKPKSVKKAAVIGAGVMGAPIAAILANAGVEVSLLDIVPKDATDRNVIAKGAIARMAKASLNPAADPLNGAFLHPSNAALVKPGNLEDNMGDLADADWIIEVVIENLDIKHDLYKKIEAVKKPGAVLSSNTSTIPLEKLTDGMSEDMKKDFIISHFFNPPRFMKLLEIVGGPDTDPAALEKIKSFGDIHLGKDVVECKDTPGFKGNRIGVFMLLSAIVEAHKRGLSIEQADAYLGKASGFESSGVFGTMDVVGLDTIPKVMQSLKDTLPAGDDFHALYDELVDMGMLDRLNAMIDEGYTGRKGKGGFYRPKKDENGKTVKEKGKTVLESMDLQTGEYAVSERVKVPHKGLNAVVTSGDEGGEFAKTVLVSTMRYAASLVPQITDDLNSVDTAMRSGFKWKRGPFEMIDALGVDFVKSEIEAQSKDVPALIDAAEGQSMYRMGADGAQEIGLDGEYTDLPQRDGVLSLSDIKRTSKPLIKGMSASTWDIGDGVVCLEFHSMLNMIDPSTLLVINDTMKMINASDGKYKAMVIYNENETQFSAGANLGFAHLMMKAGLTSVINEMIYQGQSIYNALRHAPFPVVGAPKGQALGGGCEILLHCDAIQAHAETYMGLVEAGVGFIPGWNGIERYYDRAKEASTTKGGPFPPVRRTFEAIMNPMASLSTSGHDAKHKLWLRPDDEVTMNDERLLADAKAKALELADGYTPPEPNVYNLPGDGARVALDSAVEEMAATGMLTTHDAVVARAGAQAVSGSKVADNATDVLTESDFAHGIREAFMALVKTKGTQARIAHMVNKNKPLREKESATLENIGELRDSFEGVSLPKRELSDGPITGADEVKLKGMAAMTWGMNQLMKFMKK